MNPINRILLPFGLALIVAGLICLYYSGSMVFQFVNDPAQVRLLQYISETLKSDDHSFTGTMDGKPFEIKIPDEMMKVMFAFIAIAALGLMIKLVTALITSGAQILKLSQATDTPQDTGTRSRHIT